MVLHIARGRGGFARSRGNFTDPERRKFSHLSIVCDHFRLSDTGAVNPLCPEQPVIPESSIPMKVIVFVKATAASEAGAMPDEQLLRDMGNYNEELVKAGIMEAGEGLHPSSKGARVRFSGKNRTVIDGPFAETKELIAGFWIWKVNSMAEAIEWLKKCPNPHPEDCELEIRQIFSTEDFGAEFTPELREQEASIRAQSLGLGAITFLDADEKRIVGTQGHYTPETVKDIPQQWAEFGPKCGLLPDQIGTEAYGVTWNGKPDCSFDYLTGVAYPTGKAIPDGMTSVILPAGRYARFFHDGHVSKLPAYFDTIWAKWVPDCGLKIAKAPCFEVYTEEFDPQTGMGGTAVWIPLEA